MSCTTGLLLIPLLKTPEPNWSNIVREALFPSGSEEKLMFGFVLRASENNRFLRRGSGGGDTAPVDQAINNEPPP